MGSSSSSHTRLTSEPDKERGVLDRDVAESCCKKNKFKDLKGRDQEAFFRFLRGNKYPEKEDICSVDPEKLGNLARKYQFWLKCEKTELVKLFEVYILPDDDDKRLQEVNDCVSEGKEDVESLKKKGEHAKELQGFIDELKDKMEHELQGEFKEFKKDLEGRFKKKD